MPKTPSGNRPPRPQASANYHESRPARPAGGNGPARSRGGEDVPRAPRPRPKPNVELLPHPEILEGYNYVVEGSAEVILRMFEAEQRHRQAWEDRALRSHTLSTMIGQVMGFLLVISIFISATLIGLYGNGTIAAFIWVFGMAIITMAGLVLVYVRSMGQRPLLRKPNFRRNYTPDYEGDERKPPQEHY